MLDKENMRQWLIASAGFQGHGTPPEIPDEVRVELAEKYLAAYERITGATLTLEVGDVHARIERNLEGARSTSESGRVDPRFRPLPLPRPTRSGRTRAGRCRPRA